MKVSADGSTLTCDHAVGSVINSWIKKRIKLAFFKSSSFSQDSCWWEMKCRMGWVEEENEVKPKSETEMKSRSYEDGWDNGSRNLDTERWNDNPIFLPPSSCQSLHLDLHPSLNSTSPHFIICLFKVAHPLDSKCVFWLSDRPVD